MKKFFAIFMSFILLFTFCACSEYYEDLDKITRYDDFELFIYMVPSDDFVNMFEPISKHHSLTQWTNAVDRGFSYFEYTEENYAKAFDYSMENLSFRDDVQYTVGAFTFLLQTDNDHHHFPRHFYTMFYSEELQAIGFLSVRNVTDNNIGENITFEEFIKMLFTEMNWDTGELTPRE